jgi:dienelactone hydrolase
LAFEAAIERDDLEAAVAYGGFPQHYLGKFGKASTPILAFYGSEDPFISAGVIEQLRQELAASPFELSHEVIVLGGAHHDFFAEDLPEAERDLGRVAWHKTLDFLESILQGPSKPPPKKNY